MTKCVFMRIVRTASSEAYTVWQGENQLGEMHLHYADETVHGTLVLSGRLDDERISDLIGQVDEAIVSSYRPNYGREDFVVTVYGHAEDLGTWSDDNDDGVFEARSRRAPFGLDRVTTMPEEVIPCASSS